MVTQETPLHEIFYPNKNGIPDKILSRIAHRKSLALILPNFGNEVLGAIRNDIKDNMEKALAITPTDMLLEGWIKYREIRDALISSQENPEEPITKPLVKHVVKSVHHPYLELYVGEKAIKKFEFEIAASLEVEGLVLKIQNGLITHILGGNCQGNFKLSYSEHLLADVKTKKMALIGEVSSRTGRGKSHEADIPIARLVSLRGELGDQVFTLEDGTILGRSSQNPIRLSDTAISRYHARFRWASNHWFVQDMESRLGVYVNNQRVGATILRNGDIIRVGNAEFQFRDAI